MPESRKCEVCGFTTRGGNICANCGSTLGFSPDFGPVDGGMPTGRVGNYAGLRAVPKSAGLRCTDCGTHTCSEVGTASEACSGFTKKAEKQCLTCGDNTCGSQGAASTACKAYRPISLPPAPALPSTPSGIEAAVCADITMRQQLGIAKYGQTVAENPLHLMQWLQHAYEECLDQAVYLKRAMAEMKASTYMHGRMDKDGS